ncbi:hypothetical protein E4T56_gene843, partial [Termitomyces sp. T112]
LDVIPPKEGSNYTIIVMPLLYPVNTAPFETIGEVMEFFRQIFEGLQFMHNHNVTHGDCKWDNIMADLGPLYDHPPHPMNHFMRRDFRGPISTPISRTIRPVKYYFIDFNLSKIYGSQDARLRTPPWGGDRTVPEHLLADANPCDPFPVDVYCVGNLVRQQFLDGYERSGLQYGEPIQGIEFMTELVLDMVNDNPKQRPTMDEVVARFDELVKGLSQWTLRS